MDIKTKFNIGDRVWFMRDNKPQEFEVRDIIIRSHGCIDVCNGGRLNGQVTTTIEYKEIQKDSYGQYIEDDQKYFHREEKCFASKQECVLSLLSEEEIKQVPQLTQ